MNKLVIKAESNWDPGEMAIPNLFPAVHMKASFLNSRVIIIKPSILKLCFAGNVVQLVRLIALHTWGLGFDLQQNIK